jgi:xanthine dehydrogenase accessory factor
VQPAQRLVIFGAGDDVRPLTHFAAELGWTVIVADGRPQQATVARFPQASAVMVTRTAHAVLPTDAVVLMTHSFTQDMSLLTELLNLRPRYLGLLGARRRSALLLRNAATAANLTFAEAFARVHAPIGLQLGGDGPESIALSIAAEIQAAVNAGNLRSAHPGASRRMTLTEAEHLAAEFRERTPVIAKCAIDRLAEQPVAHDAPACTEEVPA